MNIIDVDGNIFHTINKYAMVHCIAQDAIMGAGIAKQFRSIYPDIQKSVRNQHPNLPDCILYTDPDGRHIYNLVTKQSSYGKPTRDSLTQSLILLKPQIIANQDKFLAMPLIGAGLDKLSWNVTRQTVTDLFADTGLRIAIYHYK